MNFSLPPLNFDPKALPGFCSEETWKYHHGKHHATYINKLNEAILSTPFSNLPLEEIIQKSHQESNKPVFNNAAQHFNHSFFWQCLSPEGGTPSLNLLNLINRDFGTFEKFQELFTTSAASFFGSGWIWLTQNQDGKLEIIGQKDADCPLIINKKPLLTLDIWEHSYYIDHRNVRLNYISAFWKYINWSFVEKQLN